MIYEHGIVSMNVLVSVTIGEEYSGANLFIEASLQCYEYLSLTKTGIVYMRNEQTFLGNQSLGVPTPTPVF